MNISRPDILDHAKTIVCGDREHQYGGPEDNFNIIGALWSNYLNGLFHYDFPIILTPKDVASMMILLKVARNATGSKLDNWVDICGYAACGGEIEFGAPKKKNEDNETED